ncbi:MAG TPA: DUF3817 domain-containing protein [Mycobacteriales bacterium]|jgi:integral membrane protein|nr:DUF3817 domain-containing protein [Mycobacteriales bacterium]
MPAPTQAPTATAAVSPPTGAEKSPRLVDLHTPLRRFRIMAYVVGCWLLLLVGVAMPLEYIWHHPAMARVVSPIHGVLYMVYMLATVLLARRAGWTPKRTVGVMLAGTIPFVSFVIERRVVSWVRATTEPSDADSRSAAS